MSLSEKSIRTSLKIPMAETERIIEDIDRKRLIKRRSGIGEAVKIQRKRESEGDADKEYIMKLCSAESVKGSNLLIKDRD